MIVAKKEHNDRLAKRQLMLMIAIHWAIIGKKHSKRYIQQRKKEDWRRVRDVFYFGVCFWLKIFNIKLQHNNPHPKLTMPQSSLHCTHPFSRYFPLPPDCMGICTKSKHQCICRHFGKQTLCPTILRGCALSSPFLCSLQLSKWINCPPVS